MAQDHPARRSWLVRLAISLGVVLMAVSSGVALLNRQPTQAKDRSEAAPVSTLAKAVAIAHIDLKGGVTPLYPLKAGQVKRIYEDALDGRDVELGQVLFALDDTVEQQQCAQARADLEAAQERVKQAASLETQHARQVDAQKAAIKAAEQDVEVARLQHQRAQRLFNSSIGSSREEVASAARLIAKAEAAVKGEQAKLAVLEAADVQGGVRLGNLDVKAKEAQLKKAEYALSLCEVRAPEAGSVLRSLVTAGETLGPNPQRPAVWFAPKKDLIVRAEVEQEFARYAFKDGPVVIYDDPALYQDKSGKHWWKGTVKSISGWYAQRRSILMEPLQFNDVRTLECVIEFAKQPEREYTRIGQRVRVELLETPQTQAAMK